MPTLTVSIVTYLSDLDELTRNLDALQSAAEEARAAGSLSAMHVAIVDNGPAGPSREALRDLVSARTSRGRTTFELIEASDNAGYGAANNRVILSSSSEFHLVLNPDVFIERDALAAGLRHLRFHPAAALLTPLATTPAGHRQFLAKGHPGLMTLLARALHLPAGLKNLAGDARYELRDEQLSGSFSGRFLASGCFMLCRTQALQAVGGFDPSYFMYFEDFDLSARLVAQGEMTYCAEVRIVHGGGNASAKGLRHISWFVASMLRFFNRHGWHLRS